eukprot:TRINITY_DN12002_c0_g1_i1.p1 TRINITY_DN12002_c0_g1~~TRINITY_DN12002_c0_g1_i1.p1  ORF type:complete len:324 (+),score=51.86 TRINITY_DN12002_c0_g1_i1:32-1003(+)
MKSANTGAACSAHRAGMEAARRKAAEAAARARAANLRAQEGFVRGAGAARQHGPGVLLQYLRNPLLPVRTVANALRKRAGDRWARSTMSRMLHSNVSPGSAGNSRSGFVRVDWGQWWREARSGVERQTRTPVNWVRRRVARTRDRFTELRRALTQKEAAKSFSSASAQTGQRPHSAGGAFSALVPTEGIGAKVVSTVSSAGRHFRELILDPHFKFRQGLYHLRRWEPSTTGGKAMATTGLVILAMLPVATFMFWLITKASYDRDRQMQALRKEQAMRFGSGPGIRSDLPGGVQGRPLRNSDTAMDDALVEYYMAPPAIGGGRI